MLINNSRLFDFITHKGWAKLCKDVLCWFTYLFRDDRYWRHHIDIAPDRCGQRR